jgi:hypothetical protein
MRFGTFEAAYDNISRLLAILCQRNPEIYYNLKRIDRGEGPPYILQRVFFSLGPYINAFQHCRPLLCIDGTFLIGKYRLKMLTAIGVDGNNQLLPVAFAFVESENTDNWYWFLEWVKLAVVQDRKDVYLIHNRHAGILRAILDLQEGCVDTGEPPKWRDVRSRWCMRHIGANFFRQFKNKHLMDMFKGLCKETNQQKFNKQWQKLDELTGKKRSEDAAKTRTAQDEAEALCSLPTDTTRTRRRSGSAVKTFSEWIENEPKEKWALLYDTDGARYGIMTTNFAEIYNWVLRGVRGLPLVAIVEFIVRGCTDYFRDPFTKNQAFMQDPNRYFEKMMIKYMTKKAASAQLHHVRQWGTQERKFEVAPKDRARRGMRRQTPVKECILKFDGICCCSCMRPKLLHIPCSHVMAACVDIRHPVDIYVSHYFRKETIASTWQYEIYGFRMVGSFTETANPVIYIPDLRSARVKRGCRQTRCIRNDMDESELRPRIQRCSACNQSGYMYKRCPNNDAGPSSAEAGPTGDATDGRPSVASRSGRRRRSSATTSSGIV